MGSVMFVVTLTLTRPAKIEGVKGDIAYVRLELDDSPLSTAIVEALKTSPREVVQARWSGLCSCVLLGDDFTAPEGTEEGEMRVTLGKGDVVYSPKFRELVLAYDHAEFWDDQEADESPCRVIGQVIHGSREKMIEVGEDIWRKGVMEVKIE